MIELVKVEVKNFRSFAEATFTPLSTGQGLTAINGANGMGKSSIVHAVVWALYGITPDGVRVGALRRQGSEGEGDVEATVTFTFNQETIVVTRALRGKNDTTVASITLDGVEQTNVSSRTASQWITNHIGLDAEAFLTAFVIRQKELDSIVKARPAERRKTIERLAGIERMSKALEVARTEMRNAQRAVEALPQSADPSTIKDEITSLESSLQKLEEYETNSRMELEAITVSVDESQSSVQAIRQTIDARRTANSELTIVSSRIDDLTKIVASLAKKAESSGDEEAIQNRIAEVDGKAAEAKAKLSANQELLINIKSANSALAAQGVRVTELEERLTEKNEQYGEAKNNFDDNAPHSEEAIHEAGKKINLLKDSLGSSRGELSRLLKAAATIEEHAHAGSTAACPTCNQDLIDADVLLKSLNQSATKCEGSIALDSAALVESELALEVLLKDNAEHLGTVSRLGVLKSEIEELKSSIERENGVLANLEKNKNDLEHGLSESAEISALEAMLIDLDAERTQQLNKLSKLEDALAAAEELEDTEVILGTKKNEKNTLTGKLESLPTFDVKDLGAAEANHAELSSTKALIERNLQSQAFESRSLSEKLEASNAAYGIATRNLEFRQKAVEDLETKAAAASAVEEFRRDRLARLTPELSEVATDFVSKMTDGKYSSVTLDDEFTPVLTDASGMERPISWLSGGEESAVALALRVAIGEVLAGQKGGLLVLDEVLTAQDAGRRQATMGAIKSLPRQIITINHISEATDMVDLVANIVSNDDGSSTIVEWAPDVLGGVVTDEILDD